MALHQVADIFTYKGRDYKLQPYLLRPYFAKYPERELDKSKTKFFISSHHRLYQAYFGVNKEQLEVLEFQFRTDRQESSSFVQGFLLEALNF